MTDTEAKQHSILLVDDEASIFEVIEGLLYREGYQLSYVSSGREALDRIDEIEPDVILLDLMMPEMDGIETCQQIKANQRWCHIPIIMVTALSSKEDLARCLEAGADDFLAKPVNSLELRARVRSMLRIKLQYDALAATQRLRTLNLFNAFAT
ncbi:response regulator [Oxynema aestuarii]|jgi:two-component system sensor histidine kinase/response regulator|uniref:Response regulator n=1 Tax=Oxynema aestuarii AP17 TaxID=2064643 RepID=A0A6H1TTN5_9CYAN|nr:response regulator [Oxynema aestuarii]QIZ69795.1 response regulator [Oxynema aestuarii AP17]RMH77573.1 MAG: response regulator [Cyanobacteria bacterium J007]